MIPIAKPVVSEEEKEAVMAVLNSGIIAQGPKVKELEDSFSKYCGTKYAVATTSGTSALHTALYALGIKEGDEVITTPFSFIATANSIMMQGAVPIFVDINRDTFDIDSEEIKKKITSKTKAIIPVSIFGQPYDVDAINKIAQEHNLKVIDDASQAIGSEYGGKRVGSLADVSTFSLYATKNITTGEGGILTTDDEDVYELAKRFRHHGQSEQTRYEYFDLGYNYRMTDIQAAIGVVQMKRADEINQKRIENAKSLDKELGGISGITLPKARENVRHVYHQYTIVVENEFGIQRDDLMQRLRDSGVGCAVFYPKPLHLAPFYKKQGYREGDFPVCEEISKRVLSLPVHPLVSGDDIKKIGEVFREISSSIK